MKYAVLKDGQVINVILWDGAGDDLPAYFADQGATLQLLPDDSLVGPGWSHDGADFVAPEVPPVPPMTAEQALAERNRLMAYATTQIAPLQDAVDMVEATPAEEALLLAWKQYRLAVSRTSTSAGWPSAVQWPAMPT